MQAASALHPGRDPHQRRPGSANHRDGYRTRPVAVTGLGARQLRIPRDRDDGFRIRIVPARIRHDPWIEQGFQMLGQSG
jgi:transposase-like protein